MDQILHLHEFFVEGREPKRSHVLLTITEPATEAERKKGYFLAICEIDGGKSASIAELQNIIDEIENNYYELPDQEDKSSLEVVLEKMNQRSLALTRGDHSLHCVIGALRPPEILFSFYGRPLILLFYKGKTGEYKKMDLVKENSGAEDASRHQLFSQLIQGKFGEGDYFFVSTPHVDEYFNHDRLQKIVSTRPARQSAEHVQRVLSELKNDVSFGGVIINYSQAPETRREANKQIIAVPGGSARSLSHLLGTERRTASILSSSLFPKLQQALSNSDAGEARKESERGGPRERSSLARIAAPHWRTRAPEPPRRTQMWVYSAAKVLRYAFAAAKSAGRGLLWTILQVANIVASILRNAALLFFVITNFRHRRQLILLEWKRSRRALIQNLKQLPLLTKILSLVSIILVIVVTASGTYLKVNERKKEAERAYEQTWRSIRAKKDSAESLFIYDPTAAQNELRQAESELSALRCDTEERQATCSALRSELDNLSNKARKIATVAPTALSELVAKADARGGLRIFKIQNKIIGYTSASGELFVYDLLTRETKKITPSIAEKGFLSAAVPKENDYAVLIYGSNNFVKFDPNNDSIKKIEIEFPPNAEIKDIVVYNRRLYALDARNSQIYKHNATKTGFVRGKPWIKDPAVNIQNAVNMTIEGDIFIASADGGITRLNQGALAPFSIQGLDPPLTSGSQIWSYTDLNYLYVLDMAGKRVIVLEKNGNLKSQITAANFESPSGMVIDEPGGVGYVVDGGTLYQIPLNIGG